MIYNLFYTLFLDLPIYPKIIWHSFNILKTFISEQKLRNKALRSALRAQPRHSECETRRRTLSSSSGVGEARRRGAMSDEQGVD